VGSGEFWWFLVDSGELWWVPLSSGDFCCVLVSFGVMVGSEWLWRALISGEFLVGCGEFW